MSVISYSFMMVLASRLAVLAATAASVSAVPPEVKEPLFNDMMKAIREDKWEQVEAIQSHAEWQESYGQYRD